MRTIRIHVDQPLAIGIASPLPAQAGEHVARVLRLGEGAALTLFNGDGMDYPSVIQTVGKREVVVQVQAALTVRNESPLPLTLAQGVARIVPLLTERSEVKLDAARTEKRLIHWRAVVTSACEQSGRARVPQITPALPLTSWLDALDDNGALRLALLPEGTQQARSLRFGSAGGILVVGPEGGLGERDVAALTAAGFNGLVLGPRILRTETAGLAALAALQALHGDL